MYTVDIKHGDSPRLCDPLHRTRGGCDGESAHAYGPVLFHGDPRAASRK